MFKCGFAGMQSDVCEDSKRISEYSWLFFELDKHLENAEDVKD